MDSDTQVFEDIVTELKHIPTLHYIRLGIQVQNGVVTVSGRVNSLAERQAVERATHRVAGVQAVVLAIGATAIPVPLPNAGSMDPTQCVHRVFG